MQHQGQSLDQSNRKNSAVGTSSSENYSLGLASVQRHEFWEGLLLWQRCAVKASPAFEEQLTLAVDCWLHSFQGDLGLFSKISNEDLVGVYRILRRLRSQAEATFLVRSVLWGRLWASESEEDLKLLLQLAGSSQEADDQEKQFNLAKIKARLASTYASLPEVSAVLSQLVRFVVLRIAPEFQDDALDKGCDILAAKSKSDDHRRSLKVQMSILKKAFKYLPSIELQAEAVAPLHYLSMAQGSTAKKAASQWVERLPDSLKVYYGDFGESALNIAAGLYSKKDFARLVSVSEKSDRIHVKFSKGLPQTLKFSIVLTALAQNFVSARSLLQAWEAEPPTSDAGEESELFIAFAERPSIGKFSADRIGVLLRLIDILEKRGNLEGIVRGKAFDFLVRILAGEASVTIRDAIDLLEPLASLGQNIHQKNAVAVISDRMSLASRYVSSQLDLRKEFSDLWGKAPSPGRWKEFVQLALDICVWAGAKCRDTEFDRCLKIVFACFEELFQKKSCFAKLEEVQKDDLKSCFSCGCDNCVREFFVNFLGWIANDLGVISFRMLLANLKEDVKKPGDQSVEIVCLPSVDPFLILGLTPQATKSVVMKRVMELMKSEPSRMAEFRRAQADIFDAGRIGVFRFFKILEPRVPLSTFETQAVDIDVESVRNLSPVEFTMRSKGGKAHRH